MTPEISRVLRAVCKAAKDKNQIFTCCSTMLSMKKLLPHDCLSHLLVCALCLFRASLEFSYTSGPSLLSVLAQHCVPPVPRCLSAEKGTVVAHAMTHSPVSPESPKWLPEEQCIAAGDGKRAMKESGAFSSVTTEASSASEN